MNPIEVFESWFAQQKEMSNVKLPAACCLSTIGVDGYPNARFVSLKEIVNGAFVITGPSDSRKGIEVSTCSKASLTFWWSSTERQVRIQGDVTEIPESMAELYFDQRNRDSKIVSSAFDQGKEIDSIEDLRSQFQKHKDALGDDHIQRPQNWGGIYIHPIRIEFMEFRQSRLHERSLYVKNEEAWEMKIIQP